MRQSLRKIRQGRTFRRYALPINDAAKSTLQKTLEAVGRYRHYRSPPCRPDGAPVSFEGDNPNAGETNSQTRNVIDRDSISIKTADNIVYTRFGLAWANGCLMREYSAKDPSYMDLLASARPVKTLESAAVVQSFWTTTYGDWIGEHLSSLIYFGCPAPVLALPGFLEERGYVRRDCKRLGLNVVFVNEPTLIEHCVVLPKVRYGNYFVREDPKRFCEAFGVTPSEPRAGSVVYLTRRRASAQGPARPHPFEEIVAVMEDIGARIVDTDDMGFDDWLALGPETETVIADHGAALFNMMYWRPRCVIEFFSGSWWNNSFLFVGDAVGVERHFLFNTDGLDRRAIASRVKGALAAFRSGEPLDYTPAEGPDSEDRPRTPKAVQNSVE